MVGPADRVQSAEGGGPPQCDQAAGGLHRQGGAHPAHHGVRRARQSPLLPPPVSRGGGGLALRGGRGRRGGVPAQSDREDPAAPAHQQGPALLRLAGRQGHGVPQQEEGKFLFLFLFQNFFLSWSK